MSFAKSISDAFHILHNLSSDTPLCPLILTPCQTSPGPRLSAMWLLFNVQFSSSTQMAGLSLLKNISNVLSHSVFLFFGFFVCLFFFPFRATPMTYGSSQARGQIGAAAVSLCHSHSNMQSKPYLWTTQQLTAMLDPLTYQERPGI